MLQNVSETSNEYTKFLDCNITNKLKPLNKSINDMLARLEEFQTMICFAKDEQTNATNTLQLLLDNDKNLHRLFERINAVEKLVGHVKDNLNSLEEKIEKEEEELGCTEPTVTNLFTPLFAQKRNSEKKSPAENSDMFKTENYFH